MMTDDGGHAGYPAVLRRSSSSASASWSDSTIHNNFSVKYDVNASALSVDATGTVGVLAARKGLYVVDLESPYQPARTLHHQTKWDVTVVKCNPHVLYKGVVASTSNHNTLLWNIDYNTSTHIGGVVSSHQPLMSTLRAHTRPVSDVAWSPSEPTLLASSSADTTTHLWDIRTPQKPAQSLCAFTTSATQVEWNCLDAFSLATAHAGEVRVWDTRACDKPTVTITAHMQKIYGIDWSPTNMYELVTCSEDKTVKFWNVNRPRMCQGTVTTGAPVWRARYTPFGDALITSFHRQDNFVRLWSLTRDGSGSGTSVEPKPVFDFVGHKDLVKGFAWRQQPGVGVFQLITWGKQQELRMWKVDAALLEACGHARHHHHHHATHHNSSIDLSMLEELVAAPYDAPPPQPSPPPANGGNALVPRSGHVHPSPYKFDLASLKADFIPLPLPPPPAASADDSAPAPLLARMLVHHRHDVMTDVEEWHPTHHPNKTTIHGTHGLAIDDDPFSLNGSSGGRLSTPTSAAVREPIRRVSGGCFSGPNCLVFFDSRVAIGQAKVLHTSRHVPTTSSTSAYHTAMATGLLSRQSAMHSTSSPSLPPPFVASTHYASAATTPMHSGRPLASHYLVDAFTTAQFDIAPDEFDDSNDVLSRTLDSNQIMQLSPPFPPRRRHPHLALASAATSGAATANANGAYMTNLDSTLLLRVNILDCSTMCSPALTHRSPLHTTPAAHATAAIAAGDVEQGQMWSILAVSTAAAAATVTPANQNDQQNKFVPTPWHAHPFGSSLVQHVLELFEAAGDVSTLAAIVCAVNVPAFETSPRPRPLAADPANDVLPLVLSPMRPAGSAWMPSTPKQAATTTVLTKPTTTTHPHKQSSTLLGHTHADLTRYDGYKLAQADLLYRQGATNARCELLKHLHAPSEPHVGLTLAMYCCKCGRPCEDLYCGACKGFSVQCAVCELVVRGQSMYCVNCGHGGHSDHIVAWFATENACPTGCGCWCKQVPGPADFQIPPTPTQMTRPSSL